MKYHQSSFEEATKSGHSYKNYNISDEFVIKDPDGSIIDSYKYVMTELLKLEC